MVRKSLSAYQLELSANPSASGVLTSPVASLVDGPSAIEARAPAANLACPPGVHCGPGPVCTINDCELCPNFPGCASKKEKREAEEIVHAACDICDANGNCGCGTIFKDKRQAEKRTIDPVCGICDANGKCGCSTIFKDKREATLDIIRPVCDICDAHGNCGCGTIYKDKRDAEKRVINPICDICDANGYCGCGTIFKEKRDADVAVHPICQVCTSTGCACQAGPPARF